MSDAPRGRRLRAPPVLASAGSCAIRVRRLGPPHLLSSLVRLHDVDDPQAMSTVGEAAALFGAEDVADPFNSLGAVVTEADNTSAQDPFSAQSTTDLFGGSAGDDASFLTQPEPAAQPSVDYTRSNDPWSGQAVAHPYEPQSTSYAPPQAHEAVVQKMQNGWTGQQTQWSGYGPQQYNPPGTDFESILSTESHLLVCTQQRMECTPLILRVLLENIHHTARLLRLRPLPCILLTMSLTHTTHPQHRRYSLFTTHTSPRSPCINRRYTTHLHLKRHILNS